MKRILQLAIMAVFAGLLVACGSGGTDVGPNPELLHGRWAQDGLAQADPDIVVDQAVIEYRPDGTSSFDALMTVIIPGSPEMLFDIKANVLWTLEETVVTRTIQDATITPRSPSEDTTRLAAQLRQAYLDSPPGQLIVQYADPNELVFLDPETGAMLRYLNADGAG